MKARGLVGAVLAIMIMVCGILASTAGKKKSKVQNQAECESAEIIADALNYDTKTEELTATGNVIIKLQDGSTIKTVKAIAKTNEKGTSVGADQIEFDKK